MTTPLFLLRCVHIRLYLLKLYLLTIGIVNDLFAENGNNEYYEWSEVAGQANFDALRCFTFSTKCAIIIMR